jgi:uncharacterized protein (TIGR02996 family)
MDKAAELLAAIHANPADDALRQVYADVLGERGDPRGDFITMQLARSGRAPTNEERDRELELLGTHVLDWLADVATTVERPAMVCVGPTGDNPVRFERGFLTGLLMSGDASAIAAIGNHPNLATVEELRLLATGEQVLATADLPALTSLSLFTPICLSTIIARPAAAHLRHLTLFEHVDGRTFVGQVASCEALPALHSLRLIFHGSETDGGYSDHAIAAALSLTQVAVVSLNRGDYVRTGRSWAFVPNIEMPPRLLEQYQTLITWRP